MMLEKVPVPSQMRRILLSSGIDNAREIDKEVYRYWTEVMHPAVAHGPAHKDRASYFGLEFYLENAFVGKEKIEPDMVVNALQLHDIHKSGGVTSTKDAKISAEIAYDILRKYYSGNERDKLDRICGAIESHSDPFEDKEPEEADPLVILVYIGDKMDMSYDRLCAYISWLDYLMEKGEGEKKYTTTPYRVLSAWFRRMEKTARIFEQIERIIPEASYIVLGLRNERYSMNFGAPGRYHGTGGKRPTTLEELFEIIGKDCGAKQAENLKGFVERYEISDDVLLSGDFLFMQMKNEVSNDYYLDGILIPNIKRDDAKIILNVLWTQSDLSPSRMKVDEIYKTHQKTTFDVLNSMGDKEDWRAWLRWGLVRDMISNIRHMKSARIKKEKYPVILQEYKNVLWGVPPKTEVIDGSVEMGGISIPIKEWDEFIKGMQEFDIRTFLLGLELERTSTIGKPEITEKDMKLIKYVIFGDENYDLRPRAGDFGYIVGIFKFLEFLESIY